MVWGCRLSGAAVHVEQALVLHLCNQRLPFRMAFILTQQVFQGKVVTVVKGGIDSVCQLQVFCCIHRETQVPKAGLALHKLDTEAPGLVIEVGHDMLPFIRSVGLFPCLLQRRETAYFHVHADRAGANEWRRQAVGRKIGTAFSECGHNPVNFCRVNHRAVGGDAHDHIRSKVQCCLVIAIQDVKAIPAKKWDCLCRAKIGNWVVDDLAGCGDGGQIQAFGAPGSGQHTRQHWLRADRQEHFAWQPAGTHAGLNDGDNFWLAQSGSLWLR